MSEKLSKAESAMMGGERFSLRLQGEMTALSPVSIVTPNGAQIPMEEGDGKVAEVASLAVVSPSGEIVRVPVLTSTSLKSKIRHAAVRCALAALDEKPVLADYVYAAVGGIKSSEKEDAFDVVERDLRRAPNPVLGLFGASAPWDASRVSVGNAIPDLERGYDPKMLSQVATAARRDPFAANPALASILDPSAVPEYLGQRSGTKAKVDADAAVREANDAISKAVKAGDEALVRELRAKVASLKEDAKKAKDAAGNSVLMPYGHCYIPQGVVFKQKITLLDVTAVEAGLFLAALDSAFLDDPLVGGRLGLQYGEVSASWNVSVRQGGSWRQAGKIAAAPFEPIAYDDPQLASFLAAWRDFAASGALDVSKRVPERKTRRTQAEMADLRAKGEVKPKGGARAKAGEDA